MLIRLYFAFKCEKPKIILVSLKDSDKYRKKIYFSHLKARKRLNDLYEIHHIGFLLAAKMFKYA